MKELSIEQKAERYDEVVSKLKSFMVQGVDPLITRADVQDFFPELKESEGERIRRALIEHIKGIYKGSCTEEASKERDMFLAWLEEQGNLVKHYEDKLDRCACENFNKGYKKALEIQGKQEPTDKVNQKFKVGDWIINGDYPWKIIVVKPLEYVLQSQDGNIVSHAISHIDEQFHSFTIQDAKDGDVLATPNYIYIFNSIDKETEVVAFYCLMKKSDKHFSFGDYRIHDEILNSVPATKEQRNLLFQKMKEVGYEWDADKKKLEIIDWSKHIKYESNSPYITKEHPTWSEEDENIKQSIIDILTRQGFQTQVNWLKDRIQPQPQQEWSDEDNDMIIKICQNLYDYPRVKSPFDNESFKEAEKEVQFIKSLRPLKGKTQPQQEWSEEDEKMVKDIIAAIDTLYYHGMVNWLKLLKGRIQPQPKQEWNKEEQQIIKDAASFILSCVNTAETKEEEERLEELADKLQDLRPQSK